MKILETTLQGVLIVEPKIFHDNRGFFMESFNQKLFNEAIGEEVTFVQDNHSHSSRGVIRGLHYQLAPSAQGKLVRTIVGRIFDVAVDIRKTSTTFGRWVGVELSDKNHRQLWIPPGFAHGFVTLSETAEVLYKATDYYAPDLERVISWHDPSINISFPKQFDPSQACLSDKDNTRAKLLKEADVFH